MTRTKGAALAFYAGAVLVGALLGIIADRVVLRERLAREWRDPRSMRDRIAVQLDLDADQRARFDTILDARNRRYDSLMAPVRPVLDSVGTAARQEIQAMLTPEQRARYEDMRRSRERSRQER
jgi:Spy/CpxP family protein refolding chaperone